MSNNAKLKRIQFCMRELDESIIIKEELELINDVSNIDEYILSGCIDKVDDDIIELLGFIKLYFGDSFEDTLEYVARVCK